MNAFGCVGVVYESALPPILISLFCVFGYMDLRLWWARVRCLINGRLYTRDSIATKKKNQTTKNQKTKNRKQKTR